MIKFYEIISNLMGLFFKKPGATFLLAPLRALCCLFFLFFIIPQCSFTWSSFGATFFLVPLRALCCFFFFIIPPWSFTWSLGNLTNVQNTYIYLFKSPYFWVHSYNQASESNVFRSIVMWRKFKFSTIWILVFADHSQCTRFRHFKTWQEVRRTTTVWSW